MHPARTSLALCAALALVAPATACKSGSGPGDWMDSMRGIETGTVFLPTEDREDPAIGYAVRSSASDDATAEGVKYLNLEEYDDAADAFERGIHADPEDANAYFLAGLTEELRGNRKAAKEYYRKAYVLDSDPRYSECYRRVK